MKIKLPVRVGVSKTDGWTMVLLDAANNEVELKHAARALNAAPLTKAERAVVKAAQTWLYDTSVQAEGRLITRLAVLEKTRTRARRKG